ncbi:hypothetical protein F511_30537 [Dorcoceras hygrometricum]|uniref:Uncharacterized protein n=1 Tax=Dorcoceras hygrometricum TaxID=472368 RepID=A0A2Z7CMF4_9LAMI|nr:hypothetical protein F511_30537 [Dorcoceras hygrometricum]
MFKALESTGLCGFLVYPSVLYEDDLVAFFAYSFVRENEVISCFKGKFVGISEEQFAGVFELPTKGLTSMDEVPKDLIYDARSVFSANGEMIKTSCKKKEMKIEFLLMNDILEKSVTVKTGSFDVMITKSSKQAKGFAAQICVLFKGALDLTLGEAKTFPPLKILTVKTVGTYVAKNKNITAKEETDEPPVEKVVKKDAAKRRPAPAVAEPTTKKKRTTLGRATPAEKNLALVPMNQMRRIGTDKERTVVEKPNEEERVEDIVAKVIKETTEIEMVETETVEPVVMETAEIEPVETESRIDVSAITNYDVVTSFKVLSNEEGPLVETEKEKEKETEKEAVEPVQDLDSRPPYSAVVQKLWSDFCVDVVQFNLFGHLLPVGTYNHCTDIVAASPVVDIDAVPTGIFNDFQHRIEVECFCDFFVQSVFQYISSSSSSESLESIRPISPDTIPASPSSSASSMHFTDETSQITLPPFVHPSTGLIADIPQIEMPTAVVPSADYTKSFSQLRASIDKIQLEHVRTKDDVANLKAALSSKITNLVAVFANTSSHQGRIFRNLIHDVQQEIKTQQAALSQDLNDFARERSARVRRDLLCVARVLGTDVNAGQLSCSDRCCVRSVFPAFSGSDQIC